ALARRARRQRAQEIRREDVEAGRAHVAHEGLLAVEVAVDGGGRDTGAPRHLAQGEAGEATVEVQVARLGAQPRLGLGALASRAHVNSVYYPRPLLSRGRGARVRLAL